MLPADSARMRTASALCVCTQYGNGGYGSVVVSEVAAFFSQRLPGAACQDEASGGWWPGGKRSGVPKGSRCLVNLRPLERNREGDGRREAGCRGGGRR